MASFSLLQLAVPPGALLSKGGGPPPQRLQYLAQVLRLTLRLPPVSAGVADVAAVQCHALGPWGVDHVAVATATGDAPLRSQGGGEIRHGLRQCLGHRA